MFLPLVITLFALIFLPDIVPVHYGKDSIVNRYGSKYEMMIFPTFIPVFGYFFMVLGNISSKQERPDNNNNEKITIYSGLGTLLRFHVLCYYFLFTAFHKVENLNDVPVDLYTLSFTFLGLIIILIGNQMPKLKINSIVGLRTSWSMKNETTWKKSQKFGGIGFIITGILIVIGNVCIFHGEESVIFTVALLLGDVLVSAVYTYVIARKY